MATLKNVLVKMIEKKELEGTFGHASCFDYPEQYERMEELATEINEALTRYEEIDVLRKHLFESMESIAIDTMNGNYDLETISDIAHYTQDDFIEIFITDMMDESARTVFDSLFNWMDSDSRSKWIEVNYLAGEPNTYSNQHIDFVLMIQ
jgi:hypothetical protein